MRMATIVQGVYSITPYASLTCPMYFPEYNQSSCERRPSSILNFALFDLNSTSNPNTPSTFAKLDFFIYPGSPPTARRRALAFAALTWPCNTAYSTPMSRPCCYGGWICAASSAVETLTIACAATAEVGSRRIRLTAVSTSGTKSSFERSHSLLQHLVLRFHDLHFRPIGGRIGIVLHCGVNALAW